MFYKIVREANGEFYSFSGECYLGPYRVKYSLDKWSKPVLANTKLYVFKDLLAVREFCSLRNDLFNCHVFECQVINPQRVKFLARLHAFSDSMYHLSKFWKCKFSKKKLPVEILRKNVPSGTVGVDKVKLTKWLYRII